MVQRRFLKTISFNALIAKRGFRRRPAFSVISPGHSTRLDRNMLGKLSETFGKVPQILTFFGGTEPQQAIGLSLRTLVRARLRTILRASTLREIAIYAYGHAQV
jgi:hypothetical protein